MVAPRRATLVLTANRQAAAAEGSGMDAVPTVERHTSLNRLALSATLHCLTGCSIGEVAGMVIGTTLNLGTWSTVALSVALAFVFGYLLTTLPLLRAGVALRTALKLALASDTVSITVMEIVDNIVVLAIPGAMEAGLGEILFWGSLTLSLLVAAVVAFPVVRWLIARNQGHAVVHQFHARGAGSQSAHH
jgi:hypothetical protein